MDKEITDIWCRRANAKKRKSIVFGRIKAKCCREYLSSKGSLHDICVKYKIYLDLQLWINVNKVDKKNQSKIDEIYYSAIQSAENNIAQAEQQISSIDAQLAAVSSGQNAYTVKAPTSGVLHILGNYKSGMVVQTTNTVAIITPENSQRILECYVSTADMARMKPNDEVQVVIDVLSQSVYGSLTGTVKHIDSNVTTQQTEAGNSMHVFKVLISIDTDYLVSKSGDKVNIVNGMTGVARIQYDKVTYFNYVLEKLGLKSK